MTFIRSAPKRLNFKTEDLLPAYLPAQDKRLLSPNLSGLAMKKCRKNLV